MADFPPFPITVDALTGGDPHTGGVESHRFLEIPISGPGSANTLVTITGVAIPNADIESSGADDLKNLIHGDIFIKTDYQLKESDQFLQAATYASLASITFDDNEGDPTNPFPAPAFTAAVDSIETTVFDNRIQVHLVVGIQGDTTINRISYQANVLLKKAEQT
jgi:hypothetical protein